MADTGTTDRRAEPKRIQFEFSPEAVERLNEIKEMSQAGSYAELVRNALRVYEWAIKTERAGREIGEILDDRVVRVVKFL